MLPPTPMRLLASLAWASSVLVAANPAPPTKSDYPQPGIKVTGPDVTNTTCPDYSDYSQSQHAPLSTGRYKLSSMRPAPGCRTFVATAVDNAVTEMKSKIKDPDLYRLFQNACELQSGSHACE